MLSHEGWNNLKHKSVQADKDVHSKLAIFVARLADDMSCTQFAFANVVTIMYHILEAGTHNMSEGDAPRPLWLNSSVHIFNSICVWVDLLLSQPRTFNPASRNMTALLAASYFGWILVCREVHGKFPYPFLNHLPHPSGVIGVATASVIVLVSVFQLGRLINNILMQVQRRFVSSNQAKHKVI
eukprot:gene32413-31031_t